MVTTTIRIKRRAKVRLVSSKMIGIHTMEAPETAQTAENVARYFDGVEADSHWCIDSDSRVRVIEDEYVAWTTPGLNSRSRNIEFAGYAKQNSEDWADAYSIAMLEIGALSAAEWCIQDNIPVRKLTDKQIANYEPGFFGHVDANRVFKKSSHWDPGPAFPWEYFLGRVRAKIAELSGKPAEGPVPTVPTPSWDNRGYSMEWIAAQQAKLIRLGYDLGAGGADGKRGPKTIAATTAFQAKVGLKQDGIPGPDTSKALDAALASKPSPSKPAPAPAKPKRAPHILPTLRETPSPRTADGHVGLWQAFLHEEGYGAIVGTVDGKPGPSFARATKAFQEDRGLTSDGVVGKLSWSEALLTDSDSRLRRGDRSKRVEILQNIVGVTTDQVFGANTEDATQQVQRYFGVTDDGIVGPVFVSKYRDHA